MSLQELRYLFISILRSAYEGQIRSGELEDRQFLAIAFEASLDFAEDAVGKGEPLKDWDFVQMVEGSISAVSDSLKTKIKFIKCGGNRVRSKLNVTTERVKVERSLSL